MAARISALPQSLPTAPRDGWDVVILVLICAGLSFLLWIALGTPLMDPLLAEARNGRWGAFLVRPTVAWVAMGTLLLAVRTAMWTRYRSFAPCSDDDAPALTVVIPAYNEGRMVEKSIESVVAARYPRERLQVIAIDDGSTDDTWKYIERAAARHPGIVTTLRMPSNGGKRAALAAGCRAARGDILVTIDSDSVIEPRSLLAMAGPFRDAGVGAVAGKVAVHNRRRETSSRACCTCASSSPSISCAARSRRSAPSIAAPARSRPTARASSARCSSAGSARRSSASAAPTARTARSPTSSSSAATTRSTSAPRWSTPWCRKRTRSSARCTCAGTAATCARSCASRASCGSARR